MVTDKEFRELEEKVEQLLTLQKYEFVSKTYQRLLQEKSGFMKSFNRLDIKDKKKMDDLDNAIQGAVSYLQKTFGKIDKIIKL